MTGSTAIPLNTWTHIAVSRSNTTWAIYINGESYKTDVYNANPLANANFGIGSISASAPGFSGQISDVRAWNTLRTPQQIAAARAVRLNGTEAGLAHYWPLNAGSGTTAADLVSSANGTLSGATWTLSADLPILAALPDTGSWSAPTGGNWSDDAHWLDANVPDGANAIALFTNQPPAALTVTNDLAALKLGQLVVNGAAGHTFSGNALTFTNAVQALISSSEGAHTFALPFVTTSPGMILAAATPAALTFSNVISGTGPVTVNPSASGGGTVALAADNTYTGPTATGCGTLVLDTLNDGGTPGPLGTSSSAAANLLLGPGTLRYTGASAATDRGYTVQAGGSRAAVLDTDADLTFGGQVLASSGAFVKTGAGTLSFTYPGWNKYIASEGSPNAFLNLSANGDSPTLGYSGFTIAQGKVVLGVPGQINVFSNRLDIGVYSTTNAHAEHSAELVVNDGTFICNTTLSIGRNNGNTNTAPAGTASKLTINGGDAFLSLVAAGHNALGQAGFNPRSVFEINGGTVEISSTCNMGEHSGSQVSLNVKGGHLKVNSTGASIRLGAGSGEGTMTVTGDAVVETAGYLSLALNAGDDSKGTCHLDGGTLIAANITKGAGTNAVLNFNGGTFKPNTAGRTLSGLSAANVRAGGARIDTSLSDFTVSQNLLHDEALGASSDGGLVKLGTGMLTLASAGSTYNGPTVVSNGTLRLLANPSAASALQVAPEGEVLVGGSAGAGLATARVALDPGGTLAFAFTADGSANDRLHVASSPDFGTGRIALYLQDSDLPFTRNGTYTLMTYSGANPDPSGLTCANPVFGKSYAFAASGGSVTVTIATDAAGASVWNADASGVWATGANWTQPQPGTAGSSARFDDAISGPVTVTTAGETVGALYFNNPASAYTLGGSGLTLDNGGAAAQVAVESGRHAISAPLTLSDAAQVGLAPGTHLDLGAVDGAETLTVVASGSATLAFTAPPTVSALALDVPEVGFSNSMSVTPPVTLARSTSLKPAAGAALELNGTLSGSGGLTQAGSAVVTLAAANTYTGLTAVNAGTLRLATLADGGSPSPAGASSAASANLILGKGTLHVTSASSTDRGYTLRTGSASHAAVLRVEGDVTFGGQIKSESGAFLKTGPGTVTYAYPGANTLNTNDGGSPSGLQNIGPYGDAPTAGVTGFTITQGKVVLGAPNQTNGVNRIDIGLYTTTQPGQETAGELVVNGGVLNSGNTVSVGRNNGTTVTAGPGGVSSRLTVNGGLCNFPTLASGNNGAGLSGFNARPVITVTGGQVNVGGSYLSVGESPGSQASLLISGGFVNIHPAGSTLRIGGWNAGGNGGNGTVRLSGGTLYVGNNVEAGYGLNSEAELHLDGGTLTARTILGLSGSRKEVWFNGGTFRPHAANQTLSGLTAAYVSTNGAIVDTTLADGFTVAQNLLHDPLLGDASDGGLMKLGTNTLSLTGAANAFNGPVRVQAGLLRARLGPTNDLAVAAGSAFDAIGLRATVGNLTGSGLLTNGVIAVTGTLDAGTNGAPAGARMTVQNLSLVGGATFACPWATNALGHVTNDFVTVTGALAAEGPGFIDLGGTEANPIPMPFQATIMSYGAFSGSFAGWKTVNTGVPSRKPVSTVVTASGGFVTLNVQYGGTLFLLR
jgi:fibronectin-binding autotransporter adhesin